MLATTSNAIIVGFNVRPDANAKDTAARNKVDMRMYRVIYDCINEMEAAMKGMLAPKFKEVALGTAEVREVYKITGVGIVAGRSSPTARSSARPGPPGAGRHRDPRGRAVLPCDGLRMR